MRLLRIGERAVHFGELLLILVMIRLHDRPGRISSGKIGFYILGECFERWIGWLHQLKQTAEAAQRDRLSAGERGGELARRFGAIGSKPHSGDHALLRVRREKLVGNCLSRRTWQRAAERMESGKRDGETAQECEEAKTHRGA